MSWKSVWDPKQLVIIHETGQNQQKLCVDDRHINAPWGFPIVEITPDPKIVINSPQNGPESAKIASVDDLHVIAPWASSIMEITLGPQTVSYSPRNGPESAKLASVVDQNVIAPWGSTTMEITSGPQNGE